MAEIAPITGVPEGTLYRWRWQGLLLTAYDYEADPDMAFRIAAAEGKQLAGPMPDARFTLEDVTRLTVVGRLGQLGWDRCALLAVLAVPYAVEIERDKAPRWLALYLGDGRLQRLALDTVAEVMMMIARFPLATIISLAALRQVVKTALATVDLERERKAARRAQREVSV